MAAKICLLIVTFEQITSHHLPALSKHSFHSNTVFADVSQSDNAVMPSTNTKSQNLGLRWHSLFYSHIVHRSLLLDCFRKLFIIPPLIQTYGNRLLYCFHRSGPSLNVKHYFLTTNAPKVLSQHALLTVDGFMVVNTERRTYISMCMLKLIKISIYHLT